jgi:hypothetical protein
MRQGGVGIGGLSSVGRCIAFGLDLCESPEALVRPADHGRLRLWGVGGQVRAAVAGNGPGIAPGVHAGELFDGFRLLKYPAMRV